MNEQKRRASLRDAIEDNSKLLTAFAAFAGLAAFAQKLPHPAGHWMACLALVGVILFGLELVENLPPSPRSWRVFYFELLILAITGLLVLDLAVEYRDIRQTHLVVPIMMLLLPATSSILRNSSLLDRLSKRPAVRYLALLFVFYATLGISALLAIPLNATIDRVVSHFATASEGR